jgi:hypothetical protein
LIAALERSDPETVASAIQQQARGSQRAAPIGPLKQLHDADTLRDETPIRLRGHLAATLQHVKGPRIVLRSRAGDFPVSEAEAASVKMLMSDVVIPAKDLGFDLVRRMMLAGVAVID